MSTCNIQQTFLIDDIWFHSKLIGVKSEVAQNQSSNFYFEQNLYNKRRHVCLSVCLSVCSVWPAKRLGRSRRNLTHALMSTQGVFLARSMSRSFTYACESDRSMNHPERCANKPPSEQSSSWVRTPAAAPPSERLRNAVELHSSSNVRRDSGEAPKAPSSERRSHEQNSVWRTGN